MVQFDGQPLEDFCEPVEPLFLSCFSSIGSRTATARSCTASVAVDREVLPKDLGRAVIQANQRRA